MRRMHKGVAGVQRNALAVNAVALAINWRQVCHSLPAANIAPGAGKGEHGYIGVVLHDGVVNALRPAGFKRLGLRAHKAAIVSG